MRQPKVYLLRHTPAAALCQSRQLENTTLRSTTRGSPLVCVCVTRHCVLRRPDEICMTGWTRVRVPQSTRGIPLLYRGIVFSGGRILKQTATEKVGLYPHLKYFLFNIKPSIYIPRNFFVKNCSLDFLKFKLNWILSLVVFE